MPGKTRGESEREDLQDRHRKKKFADMHSFSTTYYAN
jgi:hypothetical protein